MSWTDWAQLAVSAYGAYSGNKASKNAGKQAQQGAQASNDLMKWMYEQDQKRQQPFYNTGVAADSRLAQLLGLSATVGAPSPGVQSGQQTPTQWFGSNGKTARNEQLYEDDPLYRKAWDEVWNDHYGKFQRGYNKGSDTGALSAHMKQVYEREAANMASRPTQPAQSGQQSAFDAFRNTPGYQFGLDEGRKTLEASAAAAGGLNSGATLRALTRYGQGYADQQGYRPYVSDLMQLSGRGQAQASSMGAQGMQYANQMGANLQNAANARAQSTYQRNQNLQQGLGSLSSWLGYMGGSRSTGSGQRVTGADSFGYGYGW